MRVTTWTPTGVSDISKPLTYFLLTGDNAATQAAAEFMPNWERAAQAVAELADDQSAPYASGIAAFIKPTGLSVEWVGPCLGMVLPINGEWQRIAGFGSEDFGLSADSQLEIGIWSSRSPYRQLLLASPTTPTPTGDGEYADAAHASGRFNSAVLLDWTVR